MKAREDVLLVPSAGKNETCSKRGKTGIKRRTNHVMQSYQVITFAITAI